MIALLGAIAEALVALVKAEGDAAKEEEALMQLAEIAKAELDRRKFG